MDTQRYLFELLNASAGLSGLPLALAFGLAEYVIYLIPIGLVIAWLRGAPADRRELPHALYACGFALILAQAVGAVFPEARPFALNLGHQYLAHIDDPGLPSDHVTVLWSLALAAFATIRYAAWGFPLGLAVGWSRVYLGVHFPLDILAALPVAALGAAIATLFVDLAGSAVSTPLVTLYGRLEKRWQDGRSARTGRP